MIEQILNAHKRRHQGLKGYPCPRKNCTQAYNNSNDLQQHLNGHDGIPLRMYKCDFENCDSEFSTRPLLQTHMRRQHDCETNCTKYVCETCGTVFKSAYTMRVHGYLHVDQSLWPYKCNFDGCSKRFRSKEKYETHKRRHYGIKPYACTYCDKRFCAIPNLKAHINFHTLSKKWQCRFCPKISYTPADLRLHIRLKHENNPLSKVQCRFCDKQLASHSVRKCHERKHTGERPFMCENCGHSFTNKTSLNKHKLTHLPKEQLETLKKFRCSFCNKTLTTAHSLKYHEMKHTGEKPYKCEYCGVKFRYQSNIHKHQKLKICRKSETATNKDDKEHETAIELSIVDEVEVEL